ncbi:hypothetical protein KBD59_00200 [Candidatus Gracilibacteria bacterium]|nr:hypothetical protein [Candidatus Gracilibacteria bacterium]
MTEVAKQPDVPAPNGVETNNQIKPPEQSDALPPAAAEALNTADIVAHTPPEKTPQLQAALKDFNDTMHKAGDQMLALVKNGVQELGAKGFPVEGIAVSQNKEIPTTGPKEASKALAQEAAALVAQNTVTEGTKASAKAHSGFEKNAAA